MSRAVLFAVGGALAARYLVLPYLAVHSTMLSEKLWPGLAEKDAGEKYGPHALVGGAAAGWLLAKFI